MRIASFALSLAALLAATPLAAQTAAPPSSSRGNLDISLAGQAVDEMIAEFARDNDVPGISVAIVQAPYVTRAVGFGFADAARRTLVTTNTVFDVAEGRNAYTAVAVMQLVEAGQLDLDKTVGDGGRTLRQMLRRAADYPQLEKLVATASGETYQSFVRKGQFDRLGLQRTFFGSDLDRIQSESFPPGGHHSRFLREPALINPTEAATGYRESAPISPAPGAIYASAIDVSIWDIGLAGEILVKSPALRKLLYEPEAADSGRRAPSADPWDFPGRQGLMVVTGSANGFSSLLSRFTKSDELVCVTLLANKEGLDLTQLARRIAGAYDARLAPPPAALALRVQESPYTVNETINRLERILKARGVTIVARVDHAKAAAKADLALPATEELIFGDPSQGTKLMQASRAVVADLPLRAAAWEENGAVWLAATDPVEIARRGGIAQAMDTAQRMRRAIDQALLDAVSGD